MKLIILLLVVIVCSAALALTETEITQKWNDFKVQFNRKYADEKEEQFRKQLFINALQLVEEHNKKYEQGLESYTLGINMFADMTEEEKRPYTHGVARPQQ